MSILRIAIVLAAGSCICLQSLSGLGAAEWTVPLAGNSFRTQPSPSGRSVGRDGTLRWGEAQNEYSVYFHVDRPSEIKIALRVDADQSSRLRLTADGKPFEFSIAAKDQPIVPVGTISVPQRGYVSVSLQGLERSGSSYGGLKDLIISSETADLKVDYVRDNQGNMFYWGRRGPSVHLRYEVPSKTDLRYAYSEIQVPVGQDAMGSYFMANGFGEGYFGFQVNSETERRVLFSVWSPFKTDNPKEIPEDQRIARLANGKDVHVGKFGNEGSGGQSYLRYPWRAGRTYRFLTKVQPDGKGSTIYTAWFGDKEQDEWKLIASFRRPRTDTNLRGFHCFLENFNPAFGHIVRSAQYRNVWVCDTDLKWHQCVKARFSVDATGNGRHRLDFIGGSKGDHFYLKNCGFFDQTGTPGETFERKSTAQDQPDIDFDSLPMN